MKISVIADCHLGFGYNTEFENDSFENFSEALDKSMDCDVIIIAGDLFDSRSPRTTVWARAISLLAKPLLGKSDVSLVSTTKNLNGIHNRTLQAVPVIALHGNHDRRMKGEINAIQALENAGILVHLHKENIVFEKNGTRVAIHGMSSVPERYAKQNLQEWNPQPIPDCFNILVIHQNVAPYVYSPLEPPSLGLTDLPQGFDMVLDGHIHVGVTDRVGDGLFIIIGSTTITQFDKKESGTQKGFYKFNFEKGQEPGAEFVPLQNTRKFFYEEIKPNSNSELREEIEKILNDKIFARNLSKPPIIRFKIFGKESDVIDQDLAGIEKKYVGRALISFSKELDNVESLEKAEFLRNLKEQKFSIEEIGLNLFMKNLEELNFQGSFNFEDIFAMLSDGAVEKAFAVLTGDQKTLYELIQSGAR